MIPSEPKWINAGSVRVRYYDEGRGEAVLLLHGLGGFAEHWLKNIGPLSTHFRVIVPDIVGFGFTDKPRVEYTLEYFAGFVQTLLDALRVDRVAIVGTSLGGGIAIQHSLTFPGRLGRLVLAGSTGLRRITGRFIRKLLLPVVDALTIRPNRWMLEFAYRQVVHRYGPDFFRLVALHYDIFRLPDALHVFYEVSRCLVGTFGFRRDFLLSDRLRDVHIPTLLIAGKQDRVIPRGHSALAKELFPQAAFVEVEDCGHMPYFEKPDEFNTLVIDFLKN